MRCSSHLPRTLGVPSTPGPLGKQLLNLPRLCIAIIVIETEKEVLTGIEVLEETPHATCELHAFKDDGRRGKRVRVSLYESLREFSKRARRSGGVEGRCEVR